MPALRPPGKMEMGVACSSKVMDEKVMEATSRGHDPRQTGWAHRKVRMAESAIPEQCPIIPGIRSLSMDGEELLHEGGLDVSVQSELSHQGEQVKSLGNPWKRRGVQARPGLGQTRQFEAGSGRLRP